MASSETDVIAREMLVRRADFPQLTREFAGRPLIYLDSAATTLKPHPVIDAVCGHYSASVGAVHRATHALGEAATAQMEDARRIIAAFLGVRAQDVAFVRSATEAINLLAASVPPGSEVTTPPTEHHSNLLPWRRLQWSALPVDGWGRLNPTAVEAYLGEKKPALIAFSAVSNAFGVRQPTDELIRVTRRREVMSFVDVSQVVGREPLNLNELDCDFAGFSGHKMLGPAGIGVLYVHERARKHVQPLLLGGGMVAEVSESGFVSREFPHNLEAGSPNVEGVIGLAAAAKYLDGIGTARIARHVSELCIALRAELSGIDSVRLFGESTGRSDEAANSGIVSFLLRDINSFEVARILSDSYGIMLRAGYHCAQPAHAHLQAPPTLRASMHLYNTAEEMSACAAAVREIAEALGK